jgi:hypothetical protein
MGAGKEGPCLRTGSFPALESPTRGSWASVAHSLAQGFSFRGLWSGTDFHSLSLIMQAKKRRGT